MPSKYWIKLYHEILHDPKMGKLPDRLWRRAIELFLMAGETADDGTLPPVADMAWTLRVSEEELTQDLEALANSGVELITQTNHGEWYVTKFADRQAAVPDAERQKRYRERKRKQTYYGNENDTPPSQGSNEPVTNRNTDSDIDSDSNTETDSTPTEADAPAQAPSRKKPKTPKQEASQAMFSALAALCKIDWRVCTEEQRGALNQSEKKLRKEVDATPDDLGEFHRWWYTHDWRGKKNREPPEPHQVREEWGRFTAWRDEIMDNNILPIHAKPTEKDPLDQLRAVFLNEIAMADALKEKHFSNVVGTDNGRLLVQVTQDTLGWIGAKPNLLKFAQDAAQHLGYELKLIEVDSNAEQAA